MIYRDLVDRARDHNVMLSVLVELTYRCHLDCFFCYNDRSLEGRPLSLGQYETLLEDLAELQVLTLTLTGGEPLIHPDFWSIGRKARDLGFVIRLKTAGDLLDASRIERLATEVNPYSMDISLHGADAATHDRQTQKPGSFVRVVRAIQMARDRALRLKLNATLTRWNEHQIAEIFALADQWGLTLAFNSTVTPRDDGDTTPLEIAPSTQGVLTLLNILQSRSATPDTPGCQPNSESTETKNCGAGSTGVAVDPYGKVFPCIQWRRPLGNLHQRSIREIWLQSPEIETVRTINVEARSQLVRLGLQGQGHHHCMGLSEERTGDPLSLDPDAQERAKLLRQAATKA